MTRMSACSFRGSFVSTSASTLWALTTVPASPAFHCKMTAVPAAQVSTWTGKHLILPSIVALQGTTGYFSFHPTHWNLQDPRVSGGGPCKARQIGSFPELSSGYTQCPALGSGAELGLKPHRLPSPNLCPQCGAHGWLSHNS